MKIDSGKELTTGLTLATNTEVPDHGLHLCALDNTSLALASGSVFQYLEELANTEGCI
jgi:hypothetical protein